MNPQEYHIPNTILHCYNITFHCVNKSSGAFFFFVAIQTNSLFWAHANKQFKIVFGINRIIKSCWNQPIEQPAQLWFYSANFDWNLNPMKSICWRLIAWRFQFKCFKYDRRNRSIAEATSLSDVWPKHRSATYWIRGGNDNLRYIQCERFNSINLFWHDFVWCHMDFIVYRIQIYINNMIFWRIESKWIQIEIPLAWCPFYVRVPFYWVPLHRPTSDAAHNWLWQLWKLVTFCCFLFSIRSLNDDLMYKQFLNVYLQNDASFFHGRGVIVHQFNLFLLRSHPFKTNNSHKLNCKIVSKMWIVIFMKHTAR